MPSSAWEVASAMADDAAKGTPSGKGIAGHHEAREVRKDMVGGQNGDHSFAAVIHSLKDLREIARGHDFDHGHDQGSKLQPKS